MQFSNCPECGETNYYERYSHRYFDCGFEGCYGTREARCSSSGKAKRQKQEAAPKLSDEAARYRLALLDAAHAADTIAADLAADRLDEFAKRCRLLSHQMKRFAGHGDISDEDAPTFRTKASVARGLVAVFRKVRSR